jgi:hypothetical protein
MGPFIYPAFQWKPPFPRLKAGQVSIELWDQDCKSIAFFSLCKVSSVMQFCSYAVMRFSRASFNPPPPLPALLRRSGYTKAREGEPEKCHSPFGKEGSLDGSTVIATTQVVGSNPFLLIQSLFTSPYPHHKSPLQTGYSLKLPTGQFINGRPPSKGDF